MKQAILIRGASAAGKTTIARQFMKTHPEFVNIHLDDYRREINSEDHKIQREYAYKKGLELLDNLLEQEKDVIIDEQFRPEFYQPVVGRLEKAGYKILNVLIKTSLESLKERDKNRKPPVGEERLEILAKRADIIEGQLKEILRGKQIVIESERMSLDEAVGEMGRG